MINVIVFTVLSALTFSVAMIVYVIARLFLPEWCAVPIILVVSVLWALAMAWSASAWML